MRKEKKFNHKYGDYFQRGQNEIYLHTALREMNREASTEVKGEPRSLEISCFGEQKGFLFKQTFFFIAERLHLCPSYPVWSIKRRMLMSDWFAGDAPLGNFEEFVYREGRRRDERGPGRSIFCPVHKYLSEKFDWQKM